MKRLKKFFYKPTPATQEQMIKQDANTAINNNDEHLQVPHEINNNYFTQIPDHVLAKNLLPFCSSETLIKLKRTDKRFNLLVNQNQDTLNNHLQKEFRELINLDFELQDLQTVKNLMRLIMQKQATSYLHEVQEDVVEVQKRAIILSLKLLQAMICVNKNCLLTKFPCQKNIRSTVIATQLGAFLTSNTIYRSLEPDDYKAFKAQYLAIANNGEAYKNLLQELNATISYAINYREGIKRFRDIALTQLLNDISACKEELNSIITDIKKSYTSPSI